MKKIKFLLLITLLAVGCNKQNENVSHIGSGKHNFTIVTPTGAPAIAFYRYAENLNFQTNSDPANIIPMMVKEQVDIAVLPTNAGFQTILNKKVNYKCAASITFGNIYIGATGNDDNGVMDSDDYIVSFQQGAVPDKIFHYVYGNTLDSNIHYVADASEASKCLKTGKNKIC